MSRRVAILCLVFYGFFILSPMLAVWADQLPYEAPRVEQYEPSGTPIIPKKIKVKEGKPKLPSASSDDDIDFLSWGNKGIYFQTLWNVGGDVMPAAYGKAYVTKYKLFNENLLIKKGIVDGRNQIPYWLTRWKWLNNADWTIGKFDLGKLVYSIIDGYHLRLKEYGFVDLVKGNRYTPEEFNQTQYAKNQQAFYPQMKANEVVGKGLGQTKNALQEALFVTKESVKKVSWWKLTGKVGMGFSTIITSLDYSIGENSTKLKPDGTRGPGLISPEYVAALPLDFAIGAVVATISAPVGVFLAVGAAAIGGTFLAVVAGVIGALFAAFFLGLAIENSTILKRGKEWVHHYLTSAIIKSSRNSKHIFTPVVKLGMNVANKTVSVYKSVSNWITQKIGR
jgi:hypothetical protein